MRRLGSFLPGEVVGGSAVHWSGHTWRWTDMEFKVRSHVRGALRQEVHSRRHDDPGLGHHLRRARALLRPVRIHRGGVRQGRQHQGRRSSRAAIRSRRRARANMRCRRSRRSWRARCSPRPRRTTAITRSRARPRTRRAPTPIRTARNSAPASIAAICQRFGCEANAKGSPHITVIPIAMKQSELRAAHAFVGHEGAEGFRRQARHRRHLHQRAQRRGVRAAGRHRAAVRLRDQQRAPDAAVRHRRSPTIRSRRQGVVGKNYCYQTGAGATLFFEGRHFNPFMNAGGSNVTIDDFNINWDFDRGAAQFRRRLQRRRRLQHRRCRSATGRCRAARRNGARRGRPRPRSGTRPR